MLKIGFVEDFLGMDPVFASDRVIYVNSCDLQVGDGAWRYAALNATNIERHWTCAVHDNPGLFNGTIYLMDSYGVSGERFKASFLQTNFKSYLYWRFKGFPDAGVFDAFGSGILRSKEGHVILGRQALGHVNGGLSYMPGGFIDERDVSNDGCVDIDHSIEREVLEETGLDVLKMKRTPGYWLTFHGVQISIGVAYHSGLSGSDIKRFILHHLASEENPELAGVTVVSSCLPLDAEGIADFAVALLAHVFSSHQKKS